MTWEPNFVQSQYIAKLDTTVYAVTIVYFEVLNLI